MFLIYKLVNNFLIFTTFSYVFCNENVREKRYVLIYPYGGTFKIVFGIGIPIKIGSRQTLSYLINLQAQYPVARNVSQIIKDFPIDISSRSISKRDIWQRNDRSAIYNGLENILKQHGLDGNACILLSICENAKESFHHKENGLYGHLFHILLTPDYGDNEIDEDLDEKYIEAMYRGRHGLNCSEFYSNCSYNLLDIVSFLENY